MLRTLGLGGSAGSARGAFPKGVPIAAKGTMVDHGRPWPIMVDYCRRLQGRLCFDPTALAPSVQNSPRIIPKLFQDRPKSLPGSSQNSPRIIPKYPRSIPRTVQKYQKRGRLKKCSITGASRPSQKLSNRSKHKFLYGFHLFSDSFGSPPNRSLYIDSLFWL